MKKIFWITVALNLCASSAYAAGADVRETGESKVPVKGMYCAGHAAKEQKRLRALDLERQKKLDADIGATTAHSGA